MQSTYDDFLAAVATYQQQFRSVQLPAFEVAEPYDLFPASDGIFECERKWPDVWPHAFRAGVYAFVSSTGLLLYVGKSSFKNSLGARLSSYCGYSAGRGSSCMLYHQHQWKTPPQYVVAVAVPENSRFEASALEEYLIVKLQPPENSVGLER